MTYMCLWLPAAQCWFCKIFAGVWHPCLQVQHRKPYLPYSRKVVSGASQVYSCRPSCLPSKTVVPDDKDMHQVSIRGKLIAKTEHIQISRGDAPAGQVRLLLKFFVLLLPMHDTKAAPWSLLSGVLRCCQIRKHQSPCPTWLWHHLTVGNIHSWARAQYTV